MKIGTKSLLFGAHCFWLHPWFVAWGWWRMYGFPRDPRLWVAFVIHDWGYFGKPNMDGPEGERHVVWGANVMGRWFGPDWYWMTILHSRFYAKSIDSVPSQLCVADKMAIALTPWWCYLPFVWVTGELKEYMNIEKHVEENGSYGITWKEARRWHQTLQGRMADWARNNAESAWRPRGTAVTPHYKGSPPSRG